MTLSTLAHDVTNPISHDRRYQLRQPLGHGGMGAVYSALDRFTRRQVALKQIYLPQDQRLFSQTGEALDLRLALTREFQTLASLRHPQVIEVLDYGFLADGQPFLTMKLLERAQTLLDAARSQSFELKTHLLIQSLQALNYLHRRDIIHHDLKPANVLVEDGQVYLVDFGLALVRTETEMQSTGGTLAYMAPEVLQFGQLSPAADLYSLGVMAYEVFAGRHPFPTNDMTVLMFDVIATKPDMSPLDLPPPMIAVIERLLSKEPASRYHSAGEVLHDLSLTSGVPLPPETIEIRESYLQAARFVGRERELAQLEASLRQITPSGDLQTAGVGSTWLIGGESGVGKSRLVDELRTLALVRGAQVLHGQAITEGGAAYQIWREPLRRLALMTPLSDYEASLLKTLIPDLDVMLERPVADEPLLDAQSMRREILSLVIGLFRRQQQPMVLALEDLQWANESLDILEALLQIVDTLPLVIVATYRDDTAPHLAQRLNKMQSMKLDRLDKKAIALLSESMLGNVGRREEVVQLLQRETEGNVFFLVETVRALANAAGNLESIGRITLPATITAGGIQRIIQKRLALVPDTAQPLLRLAATAGRQLDLPVLQHLLESESDAEVKNLESWLDQTVNASVIEQRDGIWRFTHDKLREVLLASIDETEKPVLARRVAEAIEQVYRDDPARLPSELLAYHWRTAGDAEKELYYSEIAARMALNVSAYRDARAFAERAVVLIRADPDLTTEECERRLLNNLPTMAEACQHIGERQQALRLLDEARVFAQRYGNTAMLAKIEGNYGLILMEMGRTDEAEKHLYRAQEKAVAAADEETQALVLGNLGKITWERGDNDTALRYLNETLDIAERIQHRQRICYTHNMIAIVYSSMGDEAQAQVHFEKVLQVARESGERGRIAQALSNLGILILNEAGKYEQALDYLQQALVIQHENGNLYSIAVSYYGMANVYNNLVQPELARAYYYKSLVTAVQADVPPVIFETLTEVVDRFAAASTALVLLGYLRGQSSANAGRAAQIDEKIAQRRSLVSREQAEAALAQGKTLSLAEVTALAETLLVDD